MDTKAARTWGARLLLLGAAVALAGRPGQGRAELPAYEHAASVRQPLEAPTAVAVDAEENLYVTEPSRGRLEVFGPDGTLLRSVRNLGEPLCVAVGPGGRVLLGDGESGAVRVYDETLLPVGSLGAGTGEFQRPTGVAVDASGTIYVADGRAGQIKVFGHDLTPKGAFGSPGSGNGQFTWPVALTVNRSAEELYVVDLPIIETEAGSSSGARVQVFGLDGSYKRSFGTFGRGDGYLTRPAGVALDGAGRVYVTDSFQNVVQVFTRDGTFLGSLYDLADPLRVPLGAAYSARSNTVYVASLNLAKVDAYRMRVQTHRLSVNVTGKGSVEPAGPVTVEHDDGVAFRAEPDPGFRLASARFGGSDLIVDEGRFAITAVTADGAVDVVFEAVPEPRRWTVTASAGENGEVAPSGPVSVRDGDSQLFTALPNPGYHLSEIRVDGVVLPLQGATGYTLRAVTADHSLEARFSADTDPGAPPPETRKTWTVTAVAGANGSIEPSGSLSLLDGESVRFTVTPALHYRIAQVTVDGVSIGAVGTYTIARVTADCAVHATFAPAPAPEDPTGRFEDNGDGTLTDRTAGLTWLADASCAKTAGYDAGGRADGALTWNQALGYAAAVGQGRLPACAAGRTSWRLPNARELQTLLRSDAASQRCGDDECASNGAWLTARGFQNVSESPYWSSTTSVGAPERAWAATLWDGHLGTHPKTAVGAVLLVHTAEGGSKTWKTGQTQCYGVGGEPLDCEGSGQDAAFQAGRPLPTPRFVDNGDGTVTDPLSGASWLKDADCLGPRAPEAVQAVLLSFNAAPHDFACQDYSRTYADWRLPTREEAYALIDFSVPAPSRPEFVNVRTGTCWAAAAGEEERAEWAGAPADESVESTLWPVRVGKVSSGASDEGSGGGAGCFLVSARASRGAGWAGLVATAALVAWSNRRRGRQRTRR